MSLVFWFQSEIHPTEEWGRHQGVAVVAVKLPNTEHQSCQEHFVSHIETKD